MIKTKSHKQNTGMGIYQAEKTYDSIWIIFKALSDGQWHRYTELKEKTKLSSRTLTKRLVEMTDFQIVKKKKDVESGKYPVPVLYKADTPIIVYAKTRIAREAFTNHLVSVLDNTKDPLIVLDRIHFYSQKNLLDLLMLIQRSKKINDKEINFLAQCFLWENYRQFTGKLIEASRRIINDFDFPRLLTNQAKRQMKTSQELLKIYEKIGITVPNEHS